MECPKYKNLVIKAQLGFVPVGRDPESSLWEFAHLQTGEVPKRGDNRKLLLTEDTGLVFVLIPGRTFNLEEKIPSSGVDGTQGMEPEGKRRRIR